MKEIRGEAKYQVDPGQRVFLTVTVGNGQLGACAVSMGDRKWPSAVVVDALDLGTGAELAGKCVEIQSVVTDVNPSTNALVVSYVVRGGPGVLDQKLGAVVDADRDSAFFQMSITFVGTAP